MDRFKYLNFATYYSSEGDVEVDMREHACFSDIFHEHKYMKNKYHIHIYKEFHLINESKSNGCFLELDLIHKHLNYLLRIFELEYIITEQIDKNLKPYYDLYVELSGHNLVHRFVLTWIRALYEFPYCIYLIDVYKCKRLKEFKNINVFNILNIITSCHGVGDDIHMFTRPSLLPKLMKFKDIKEFMEKLDPEEIYYLSEIFSTDKDNNVIELSNFFNNPDFKIRKQKYLDTYNFIKDEADL